MTDSSSAFYAALENQFLTYRELAAVPVSDNGEAMVGLRGRFSGKVCITDERMREFTGDDIFVRETVVAKLEAAQAALRDIWPGADIEVAYGYRHLDIQTAKFEAHKARVRAEHPDLEGVKLDETVHRFSAVPAVAGHPTGGAVDVRIRLADGTLAPMGTEIPDYRLETYTFSPFIDRQCWHNRQILRGCMVKGGFAPFDGEWWHFSYGDREWACYYSQPHALYSQLRFRSV